MLINGNDLLAVANANDFAVPAFNISDYAMFNGVIDISEEKNAPLIVAIHPDEVSHLGVDLIQAIRSRAHHSSVPVAIHWDHGGSYEQILTAIQSGFTSVMIDESMLPFDENVAITEARRRRGARRRPFGRGRARHDRQDGQRGRGRRRPTSSTPIRMTRCDSSSRRAWTASPSPSAPRTASTRRA